MRQFCKYGSVRGVPGNRHFYRDQTEITTTRTIFLLYTKWLFSKLVKIP
jgi:hypothetical protein